MESPTGLMGRAKSDDFGNVEGWVEKPIRPVTKEEFRNASGV